MSYAEASIIEIGSTRRLDDEEYLLDVADIVSWELLSQGFLTDVFLFNRRLQFIVNSFPLFVCGDLANLLFEGHD